jgi:hypothetical protein
MKNENVSSKTIQTSLLLFEPWASATIIRYAGKASDPKIISLLVETLIGFPPHQEMYDLAITLLSHSDPEVRGRRFVSWAGKTMSHIPAIPKCSSLSPRIRYGSSGCRPRKPSAGSSVTTIWKC